MTGNFPANLVAAACLGRSWPLFEIKQALNEKYAAAEAIGHLTEILQRPAAMTLTRKRITSLAHAAATAGLHYTAIELGGEPAICPPPRVIGKGNHRTLRGLTRRLYCAALPNVSLRGRSQLLERHDDVLLDFEGDEFASMDDQLELDSAVLSADTAWAEIITASDPRPLRLAAAFSLLGPNSFAYGHWLAEYLPRLAVALEWGNLPPMPILVDAGMPRQNREALQYLLPPSSPVIEIAPWQAVQAGQLWTAPTYYYAPLNPRMNARYDEDKMCPPPRRFARIAAAMRRRFEAAIATSHPKSGKIFLSRSLKGHRVLVNQPDIEATATRLGFAPLRMENLSFAEQFRTIDAATHIAGPEGSAFFSAFFGRPGTKILILNHTHTEMLPAVTALLEAAGLDVTVLTGPFVREEPDYPHFGDYRIDPQTFAETLHRWSAQSP